MKAFLLAAPCGGLAGLLADCGSAASPSSHPTATVTVTVPASSSAAPTIPPMPSGMPGCAATALTAALGPGGGAAGSVYYPIRLTNSGAASCVLYGYPGVSFVTSSGAQVGAAAAEDPALPRRQVMLAPGGSAHAELRITDAQNYSASACQPVPVHRLRISPLARRRRCPSR